MAKIDSLMNSIPNNNNEFNEFNNNVELLKEIDTTIEDDINIIEQKMSELSESSNKLKLFYKYNYIKFKYKYNISEYYRNNYKKMNIIQGKSFNNQLNNHTNITKKLNFSINNLQQEIKKLKEEEIKIKKLKEEEIKIKSKLKDEISQLKDEISQLKDCSKQLEEEKNAISHYKKGEVKFMKEIDSNHKKIEEKQLQIINLSKQVANLTRKNFTGGNLNYYKYKYIKYLKKYNNTIIQ